MCLLYYSYFSGAYCTIPTVVLMPAYEVMTSPNLCANCAYYTIPTLVVPIILFLLSFKESSFKESSFKESRFILLLLLILSLQQCRIQPASAAYSATWSQEEEQDSNLLLTGCWKPVKIILKGHFQKENNQTLWFFLYHVTNYPKLNNFERQFGCVPPKKV